MLPDDLIKDIYSNRDLMTVCNDIIAAADAAKIPPVDLRTIPREDWPRYEDFSVALPDPVAKYLAGTTELTSEESNQIIDTLEKFYEVKHPFFITNLHLDPDFYLGRDPACIDSLATT